MDSQNQHCIEMIQNEREHWRQKLGLQIGMTKEEALEKFLVWAEKKKTCQRCEGEKYTVYCPLNLICKEAIEYDARRQADIGSGSTEDIRSEEISISHDAKQYGFDFCEGV